MLFRGNTGWNILSERNEKLLYRNTCKLWFNLRKNQNAAKEKMFPLIVLFMRGISPKRSEQSLRRFSKFNYFLVIYY